MPSKEVAMNYYKVTAKCGHVRRKHYIIKDFFLKAQDGKEAAYKVRRFPRVKHDLKDAIVAVDLITEEEFTRGCELHNQDLYFYITNSSEQKLYGAINDEEVYEYDEPERKKKYKDRIFYNKMARIQRRELRTQLAEVV